MPKLNRDIARKADAATATSFDPLPEDTYTCRLREVEAVVARSGNPMWKCTWEVADGEHAGRRLWTNLVLVESALWKANEFFAAFGVPTDTDTDELLGRTARLVVKQRVIETGPRKGEIGNEVTRVAADPDSVIPAALGARPADDLAF